jgi:hypothetical protein
MASVQADGGYFGTTLPSGQTGDNTLDSLRKRGLIPIDPYIDWQVENLVRGLFKSAKILFPIAIAPAVSFRAESSVRRRGTCDRKLRFFSTITG